MKSKYPDLVGYALKTWFTTLVLGTLNYFLIVIYLLPEARTLSQAEGIKQAFYVGVSALWGYFPTLLFFYHHPEFSEE